MRIIHRYLKASNTEKKLFFWDKRKLRRSISAFDNRFKETKLVQLLKFFIVPEVS
jgi:hypothetical protein